MAVSARRKRGFWLLGPLEPGVRFGFGALVLAIGVSLVSIVYTNATAAKMCDTLTIQIREYERVPPSSDTGRALRDSLIQLADTYGCERG